MKPNMKTNVKKVLTLMLAILSLATLLSMMPEHSSAYNTAQTKINPASAVIAHN